MCQAISIQFHPDGLIQVAPYACDGAGGAPCRDASRPYLAALGTVISDHDLFAHGALSHVATLELVVDRLDLLEQAGAGLGLEFRRDQKTWKWVGRWFRDYHAADAAYRNGIRPEDYGTCLHALAVAGDPQAFEVGIVQNPEGPGFLLVWDFAADGGRRLRAKIGDKGSKLIAAYGQLRAEVEAKRLGATVLGRETLPDGTVRMTIRNPKRALLRAR